MFLETNHSTTLGYTSVCFPLSSRSANTPPPSQPPRGRLLSRCLSWEAQRPPLPPAQSSVFYMKSSIFTQLLLSPWKNPHSKGIQSLEAGRNGNIEEHQPKMNSSVGHHTMPQIRNSMRIMKEELSQPRRHTTGWSEGWEEASLRSHDSAETSSMKKESAGGNRIQVSKGLVQSE